MWMLTLSVFVATVALWILWRKRTFSYFKRLGIPGPEPNIFFGNLWELTKGSPLVCHKEWIQKYGKVVGFYMGATPTVLVADIELLKRIQVSEFHKSINRPSAFAPPKRNVVKNTDGFSYQLTNLKDKRWKDIRSILTPSFTANKMKQMSPIINDAIDTLIENIDEKAKSNKVFDIYQFYQGLTMDIISRTAFGIQTNVQKDPEDPFLRATRLMFSPELKSLPLICFLSFPEVAQLWMSLIGLTLLLQNKGKNPITELLEMVNDVIEFRRKDKSNRRPDLLQMMIDAEVSLSDLTKVTSNDLTAGDEVESKVETQTEKESSKSSGKIYRNMKDFEILDNSMLFFLAGYETTSTALAFTTHFLIHYPGIQDKIREEVKNLVAEEGEILDYSSVQKLQYLDQVLTEALRMYPPIYSFVDREVGEDVQFGDMKFPKGLVIKVPIYTLQHDPELWPDPEKFNPERFASENKTRSNNPLAFQAFGAGPRNCIGMRFAQMAAKLALARILLKYKLVKCEETEKDPITLKITLFSLAPRNGIKLKAIPC